MSNYMKKISIFLIGFSLLGTNSFAANTGKEFSKKQEAVINGMIRDYILEHPEILPEAIQILQSRAKKAALTQNHTRLYNDGFSFVGGNKDGDVTLIEFFDYNCGFCKQALSTVERLKRNDPNLRIIYKEFPILAESSNVAAKAAMAAIKQGKYEIFHIALLKNSGKLTEDRIFEIASNVGLDVALLARDMTSPVFERNIQINHALAQALDITGTPGFIVGDMVVSGALPYEELVKVITKTRNQNKKNK